MQPRKKFFSLCFLFLHSTFRSVFFSVLCCRRSTGFGFGLSMLIFFRLVDAGVADFFFSRVTAKTLSIFLVFFVRAT